jgi:hypothetical protein
MLYQNPIKTMINTLKINNTKSLSVNNIDIWPILCHLFKQVEERVKIDPGGKYGENSIMGSL